jgi:hypothetical protein
LLNIWSVCLTRENFLKDGNRNKRRNLQIILQTTDHLQLTRWGHQMWQMVMDTVIICKRSSHLIEKYSHLFNICNAHGLDAHG